MFCTNEIEKLMRYGIGLIVCFTFLWSCTDLGADIPISGMYRLSLKNIDGSVMQSGRLYIDARDPSVVVGEINRDDGGHEPLTGKLIQDSLFLSLDSGVMDHGFTFDGRIRSGRYVGRWREYARILLREGSFEAVHQ